MGYQPSAATINKFVGGLKTEFTGINFPDDSCTDVQNCVISIIGDVTRRLGFDYELNNTTNQVNRTNCALSSYIWNNVGGDGQTKIVVVQIGSNLYFYQLTNATTSSPLSTTLLGSIVNLNAFLPVGSGNNVSTIECQYSDGNGYLFVYHPSLDSFYCTFITGTPNTISGTRINIQVRDIVGIDPEPGSPAFNNRPGSLGNEHFYNLKNQGWTAGSPWSVVSTSQVFTISGASLIVPSGNSTWNIPGAPPGIAVGQQVTLSCSGQLGYQNGGSFYAQGFNFSGLGGNVTSFTGSTITVNITIGSGNVFTLPAASGGITGVSGFSWSIGQTGNVNTINIFQSGVGIYPSNADVWYTFKNTSEVFSPSTTVGNVSLPSSPAPKGSIILNPFNQTRSQASGVSGITTISTNTRPRTGCWFQGRVWFAGVDASFAPTGDVGYYTWTENIYFSQIITSATQLGYCYQENDPTDENFFDELPTDGGVVTIQGSGAIYKLFPIQNGLLVFAANGVWFLTGSQGIGFSATDYTVTKISGVQSTSGTSFINVQGYPIFWNEEGIYVVSPGPSGSLQLTNICIDTILTFYSNIPLQSKKFARGDFDYVNHEIQWCYRSTNESSVTDRYQYDRVLVYNVLNKAFYYYTISPVSGAYIHDIKYVVGPGGSTSPSPVFKYLSSFLNTNYFFSFVEERDSTTFTDFHSLGGINYVSFFTTGYKLSPRNHPFYGMFGQYYKKFNIGYMYVFLRNTVDNSYKIQSLWDFSTSGNSGKWSPIEQRTDNTNTTNFGMIYKRHKLRGHGLAMQLKIQSVDGKPFDIMGWSTSEYFQDKP